MSKPSRVSIQDVAAAAGVSAQTVSRVVNNSPSVSDATRKKVHTLIEAMGYRANMLGRSLLHGKTRTLGVVCSGIGHTGGSRFLQGITRAATQAGYSLNLKGIETQGNHDIPALLDQLLQWQVDGILWAPPEIGSNRDWLGTEFRLPVPLVLLSMAERPGFTSLTIDNYQVGILATRHLLAQGRKRIAHIAGPQTWWEAKERKRGWEDALQEAGISVRPCMEANWNPGLAAQALADLLEQDPQIDAVFAANDHMALGVLKEAQRRGLKIPEDLAVIGVDNLAETAFYQPALTTIENDQSAIGELAVHTLVAQIEGSAVDLSERRFCLTPRLILRESA